MPERSEKLLRLACLILAALLICQIARVVLRRDGLAHLSIPPLPSLSVLPSATNAPSGVKEKAEGPKGAGSSNAIAAIAPGTNGATLPPKQIETDKVMVKVEDDETQTNAAGNSATLNVLVANATNNTTLPAARSNDTKATSAQLPSTNATNVMLNQTSTDKGTNTTKVAQGSKKRPNGPQGVNAPGKAPPELPPPIQARVDKIVQSEILGQIIHPMPMALLGIAGRNIFLRTPAGQTGMVKEGDELGGVKVLKIGINRVLVEEDGQKKELTLFSGFGSQSLLADTNSPAK